MINASADRALTIFDDYLAYMRHADEPSRPTLRVAPWLSADREEFPLDEVTDPGTSAHGETTSPRRDFTDEPTVIGSRSAHPPLDPSDGFLGEMRVLVKYGHKSQVAREIEKWLERNPDLHGQLNVIEFWIEQIDAHAGREELFGLASRAIGRGETSVATTVIEKLARDAATDPRVARLRRRLDET